MIGASTTDSSKIEMSATRDFSGFASTSTSWTMRSSDRRKPQAPDRKNDALWTTKPMKVQPLSIMSEEAFPKLGSPPSGSPPSGIAVRPKPTLLNFKKTVEEMVARTAVEEVLASSPVLKKKPKPVRFSSYRNTDDVPEDYDGPEEGEEEEDDEEFDDYATRRRGDKGIW